MSFGVSLTLPPVRDDDRVLEIYADGPLGANFVNGNFHFALATIRTDHASDPPAQYRQITARLVIPLAGVMDLQANVTNILTTLRQQGLIQDIMPDHQTKQ